VGRDARSLSLDWHLRKKMGNTLRAMDRGVESANSVVNYLFRANPPTLPASPVRLHLLRLAEGGLLAMWGQYTSCPPSSSASW
jgi:ABC-type transport system involved in Fe-S cluster assembly fused permease/ATPase subunit